MARQHSDVPLVIDFATCMGRLDRNIEKPEARVNIGYKKPSEYLRHFYYDTCLCDSLPMETLFKRVGADRMVLGSDYPVADRTRSASEGGRRFVERRAAPGRWRQSRRAAWMEGLNR
jgi:hypothetical protein